MVAAMKAAGPAFRGVAVIGADATARELEAMHEAGIRGARLNIVDVRERKGELPLERIARLAEQIKPFGWHIEFLMHVDEFPQIDTTFGGLPVDEPRDALEDRKSTRLNSSHTVISYAVFCLKKKKKK